MMIGITAVEECDATAVEKGTKSRLQKKQKPRKCGALFYNMDFG
jgi:hypothetical protein